MNAQQRGQGHKWFAACWEWMVNHESPLLHRVREEIAGGARGRVLEVGCGPGTNFPYYSEQALAVVATDPDPYMLARARKRMARCSRPIEIQQAAAGSLPFEDESFDTVVATSVLCTVRDVARALSEIRRLLKPTGEFRFLEHVRHDHAVGAFWQDLITPVWRWLGAGCRPNQDTARLIREAGFTIDELEPFKGDPLLIDPTRPCIKGVARSA